MAASELYSFVEKFKQFSISGISASLNFDTSKGKTNVCLKAEIDLMTPTCIFGGRPRTSGYNLRRSYKQDLKNDKESYLHKDAEKASSVQQKLITKTLIANSADIDVKVESHENESRMLREAAEASFTNERMYTEAAKP